jgi:hypothetical protein
VILEKPHNVIAKDNGTSFTLRASRPLDLCSILIPRCIPEHDMASLLASTAENTRDDDPVCQLLALTSEGSASDMHK